jgi:hypothetical protein
MHAYNRAAERRGNSGLGTPKVRQQALVSDAPMGVTSLARALTIIRKFE